MAREAKDAYFKHQRDELDWACEMKERETAFLAREKDYIVKVKILEHNLHTAVSEKEATIQSLLNAHSETTQQLQDYFQDKVNSSHPQNHFPDYSTFRSKQITEVNTLKKSITFFFICLHFRLSLKHLGSFPFPVTLPPGFLPLNLELCSFAASTRVG